jgi:hypothetical protein
MIGQATLGSLGVSARPRFEVGGERRSRLSTHLVRLSVSHDEEGTAGFEAVFLNWGEKDESCGSGFLYFDREILDLGKHLVVRAGDAIGETTIFDGAITGLAGMFPNLRLPEIRVYAEDRLQKLRSRPCTRFSERDASPGIVSHVARDRGLSARASAQAAAHPERWQVNPEDPAFPRDLALAADAVLTISSSDLTFAPRRPARSPSPGSPARDRALMQFDAIADRSQCRASVLVHGWSVAAREAVCEAADEDAGLARSPARKPSRRYLVGEGTTEGTPGLAVGAEVEVLDMGGWFSGRWSVCTVRHTWSLVQGFQTHFRAERLDLERMS